ncbi:hypothetical protein AAVH_00155 [Aphelenchoides avenae]|nr:hypothetical protein AAVH_00155 [Aphelenchus avenae]
MDSKTARTASVIKKNAWNIVSGQWLLRCLKRKALLPWKQDDMIHQSDAATFHLFDVPEPAEAEEVEEEEEEEATTEDVESILGDVQLDAEDAAAIETEFGVESEEVPGPSTSLFTNENCEAATSGTIFTDFIFHFHASFPKNKVASYTEKVQSQGGTVHGEMDEKATHVVINGVTTDDLDELYDWNQKKKHWLGTFVTAEWIDLSIEEEDRYRVGENPQNLLKK